MQLGSRRAGCRLTPRASFRLALLVLCAAAGCSRQPSSDATVSWTLDSTPIAGAPANAVITLRDSANRPITGARLEVTGHMSHPGMAPVVAAARERRDGIYEVHLQFPMAGDWFVMVTGTLPGGQAINQRIDVAGVRPAG